MARSERTKRLVKHQRWIEKELKEKGECVLNKNCIAKGSKIHGYGVFALRDIKKGRKVIEYVGEKISKDETDRRSKENHVYVFTLNKNWDIDGEVGGEWISANKSCMYNKL